MEKLKNLHILSEGLVGPVHMSVCMYAITMPLSFGVFLCLSYVCLHVNVYECVCKYIFMSVITCVLCVSGCIISEWPYVSETI